MVYCKVRTYANYSTKPPLHTHTHTHTPPLSSDGGDLLLASCSQDAYIRLWRIAPHHSTTCEGGDSGEEELRLTRNTFSVLIDQEGERQFTATLESVLIGEMIGTSIML